MGEKRGDATIVAFCCTECRKVIGPGKCGLHRAKTKHKTFEAMYEEAPAQMLVAQRA